MRATLAAAAWLLATAAGAQPLSEAEQRGKQIYLRGTSPSGGEIIALMGADQIEVPAAALPCAGCHGLEGEGRPEGGVSPSNLTAEALGKPYPIRHESGREHPPYTPRLLKKAISMGFDAGGNALNLTMPRYRMPHADMTDLVAYLGRLGSEQDPGISEDAVRLGTVLPAGDLGNEVEGLLQAALAEINAEGGVYGRRLALEATRTAAGESAAVGFRRLLENPTFAVLAPLVGDDIATISDLATEHEIPLLAPFTHDPKTGFPLAREVFYLTSGLDDLARALVKGAAAETTSLLVLHGQGERLSKAAGVAAKQASENLGRAPDILPLSTGAGMRQQADELAGRGIDTVLLVAEAPDVEAWLSALSKSPWRPNLLLLAPLAAQSPFSAPPGAVAKMVLAFPNLPGPQMQAGLRALDDLAGKHGLSTAHRGAQIHALAAVRLLVSGLEDAGREVSRERLIRALEGLYDHDTALTPPLTFGPNRRVGARGAYLVEIDGQSGQARPLGGWIEVR